SGDEVALTGNLRAGPPLRPLGEQPRRHRGEPRPGCRVGQRATREVDRRGDRREVALLDDEQVDATRQLASGWDRWVKVTRLPGRRLLVPIDLGHAGREWLLRLYHEAHPRWEEVLIRDALDVRGGHLQVA